MRTALRGKAIKVKMCADYAFTTVAATDYTTVKNMVPGSGFGFSSFAAVFDEYKCTHVKLIVSVGPRVNIAAPIIFPRWSLAIDFANNTAATGVPDNMSHEHVMLGVYNTNGALTWPNSFTESGFRAMSFPIPSGQMADVGIVSELMAGLWCPASDNAVIVGYVLPYFENGGGLSQFSLTGLIEYTVEWRCRG